jgi:hypothetical protein
VNDLKIQVSRHILVLTCLFSHVKQVCLLTLLCRRPREGLIYILLEFAQRFLIGMEQHYALPEERQNWGNLLYVMKRLYDSTNLSLRISCAAMRCVDKIKPAPRSLDLQQMVAQPVTLNEFFMKPFQHLTKYPLISVRFPHA